MEIGGTPKAKLIHICLKKSHNSVPEVALLVEALPGEPGAAADVEHHARPVGGQRQQLEGARRHLALDLHHASAADKLECIYRTCWVFSPRGLYEHLFSRFKWHLISIFRFGWWAERTTDAILPRQLAHSAVANFQKNSHHERGSLSSEENILYGKWTSHCLTDILIAHLKGPGQLTLSCTSWPHPRCKTEIEHKNVRFGNPNFSQDLRFSHSTHHFGRRLMLGPSNGRGHFVQFMSFSLEVVKFQNARALLTVKISAYFGSEPESAEQLCVAICVWRRETDRVDC